MQLSAGLHCFHDKNKNPEIRPKFYIHTLECFFLSRALLRIFLRELGRERGPLSLVIG
jgi:hypothetical protein